MKKHSHLLLGLAVLAVSTTLAACSGPAAPSTPDDGPIRIGMVVPLTGPYSPLGLGDKAAAEQEVAAINAAGGIDGRQVELIVADDKTDVTQSVTEFNQLASDSSISIILSSSFVSASAASGSSAQQNEIPILALGPVSAFADGSNPWAFTVPATPEVYAQAIVDYFSAEGIESLSIGYQGEDVYGQTGNEATVAAAEEAGIEVKLDEAFDGGGTDFTALITHVKEADADGFLVWGAGPAPVILTKQLEGQGIRTFMTGAEASNLYVEPSGTAAEGIVLSTSIALAGPELPAGALKDSIDAFVTPWQDANDGTYPPQFAFDGLAGIQLAKAAIEAAGSSERSAIRDALEGLDTLTAIGRFTFSPTNHSGLDTDAVAIMEISGGQFVSTPYSLDRFTTNLPE